MPPRCERVDVKPVPGIMLHIFFALALASQVYDLFAELIYALCWRSTMALPEGGYQSVLSIGKQGNVESLWWPDAAYFVFLLVVLYKGWLVLQPLKKTECARIVINPVLAVVLMAIPVVNLFWVFRALNRLALCADWAAWKMDSGHALPSPALAKKVAILSILMWSSIWLGFSITVNGPSIQMNMVVLQAAIHMTTDGLWMLLYFLAWRFAGQVSVMTAAQNEVWLRAEAHEQHA